MDEQSAICEARLRLYGSNPKMGTKPVEMSHLWFEVIGNRVDLTDGELYQLINFGRMPVITQEIAFPKVDEEQKALEWFNALDPDERLAQIKFRFVDWYNEQQIALAQAAGEL